MHKRSFLFLVLFSAFLIYQNCVPYQGIEGGAVGFSLDGPVEFAQVKAILDKNCVTCHSAPSSSNRNVGLSNYQAIMDSNVIIGGNSDASALYVEVSTGSMPQGLPALSLRETEIIRAWIEAGAPDEDGAVSNYPPTIQMPNDMTVQLPRTNVEFAAIVADQDGAILRTVWSQVAGPNTATFANSRTPSLLVSNLQVGNYTFELMAQDDFGAITTGRVNLRVNAAPAPPPPPATPTVSFAADVNPILQNRCSSCHTGATPPKGFSVDTYAQVVTRVVAGNPTGSLLYSRVANDSMPQGGPPLTAAEKTTIQTWIRENATNN